MTVKTLLRSESEKNEFMNLVAQGVREASVNKFPYQALFEIKRYRQSRSIKQNALLWAIHTRVSAEIFLRTLKQFSPEDIHNYIFKPLFCGVDEVIVNGIKTVVPKSSTVLNTNEFAEAVDRYIAMLSQDYGIQVDIGEIKSGGIFDEFQTA